DLGRLGLEARRLHRVSHGLVIFRRGQYLDRPVLVRHDVRRAGLDRGLHDPLLVAARREAELPDLREQVGDGAVGAEIAAVLRERMANLGDGAVAVVGQAVDHDRDAARAVALVTDLLVARAFELAGAALDRALDI